MLNSAETWVVLKSSSGPRNNIADNLLTKWSSPYRTQQSCILIAFSSISPKGLLPTFCKFTMSEIFILNFGFRFFPYALPAENSHPFDKEFGYFAWKGLCSVKSHSWSPLMQIIKSSFSKWTHPMVWYIKRISRDPFTNCIKCIFSKLLSPVGILLHLSFVLICGFSQ